MLKILYLAFQESPQLDPSELFTNVYVKGLGTEVKKNSLHTLFLRHKITRANILPHSQPFHANNFSLQSFGADRKELRTVLP